MQINDNLLIPGNNVIDLDAGNATREVNAGKIGYGIWDNAFNIVGKKKEKFGCMITLTLRVVFVLREHVLLKIT